MVKLIIQKKTKITKIEEVKINKNEEDPNKITFISKLANIILKNIKLLPMYNNYNICCNIINSLFNISLDNINIEIKTYIYLKEPYYILLNQKNYEKEIVKVIKKQKILVIKEEDYLYTLKYLELDETLIDNININLLKDSIILEIQICLSQAFLLIYLYLKFL